MHSPPDEHHAWLRDRARFPSSDLPNDGRLCSACPHASPISIPVPQQIQPRSTNTTQGTEAGRCVSGSGPFRAVSGSEEGQGPSGCVSQSASRCAGKAGGMSLGPGPLTGGILGARLEATLTFLTFPQKPPCCHELPWKHRLGPRKPFQGQA